MKNQPIFSQEAIERAHLMRVAVALNAVNLCQAATDAAKAKSDRSYLETLPALREALKSLLLAENALKAVTV